MFNKSVQSGCKNGLFQRQAAAVAVAAATAKGGWAAGCGPDIPTSPDPNRATQAGTKISLMAIWVAEAGVGALIASDFL